MNRSLLFLVEITIRSTQMAIGTCQVLRGHHTQYGHLWEPVSLGVTQPVNHPWLCLAVSRAHLHWRQTDYK